MVPIRLNQQAHPLPLRNGYIVDGRIGWWKIQTRRQATVMTVTGELDASNAAQFEASVRQLISADEPFIIDLTHVNFLASQCIRVFLGLATKPETVAPWALVVPAMLQPILRICDPEGMLPVAGSLPEALHDVALSGGGVVRLLTRAPGRPDRWSR